MAKLVLTQLQDCQCSPWWFIWRLHENLRLQSPLVIVGAASDTSAAASGDGTTLNDNCEPTWRNGFDDQEECLDDEECFVDNVDQVFVKFDGDLTGEDFLLPEAWTVTSATIRDGNDFDWDDINDRRYSDRTNNSQSQSCLTKPHSLVAPDNRLCKL